MPQKLAAARITASLGCTSVLLSRAKIAGSNLRIAKVKFSILIFHLCLAASCNRMMDDTIYFKYI